MGESEVTAVDDAWQPVIDSRDSGRACWPTGLRPTDRSAAEWRARVYRDAAGSQAATVLHAVAKPRVVLV